jgi:hypothetical protein
MLKLQQKEGEREIRFQAHLLLSLASPYVQGNNMKVGWTEFHGARTGREVTRNKKK